MAKTNNHTSPQVVIMQKRSIYLKSLGIDPNESSDWSKKYSRIKARAKLANIEFSLTFENYVKMALEAGITSGYEIGRKSEQYVIGRLGDIGGYHVGNCRFITKKQNIEERAINGGDEKIAFKHCKYFRLFSPSGRIFEGHGLEQFCKDNDLNQGAMASVCRGSKRQYKGWTGTYIYEQITD